MIQSPRDRRAQDKVTPSADDAIDTLSDVIGLLRFRGEVLCWSELSAPWGLSFPADEALFFHVVERGTAVLEVGRVGAQHEVVELSEGDLVVLPEGSGHRLMDARRSRVVPVMSLVDPTAPLPGRLHFGGGGVESRILCGRFRFDAGIGAAALSGLPPLLHVQGARGHGPGARGPWPEWLDLTIRYLTAEAKTSAPGGNVAMSRLVDLLFVQTVRYWLATSDDATGWVGALRDPRIGEALRWMHARPEHPWDVAALAAKVGMSRSSFAQRFVDLMGEPPSKYLTRWRVHVAARLLQSPGATVAQTAQRVGYDSEAAFSRAFKRHLRVAPAVFRDEHSPARGTRRK